MRQVLLVLTMLLTTVFFMGVSGKNHQTMGTSSKVLVAYFSATGTTAGVAEKLASARWCGGKVGKRYWRRAVCDRAGEGLYECRS